MHSWARPICQYRLASQLPSSGETQFPDIAMQMSTVFFVIDLTVEQRFHPLFIAISITAVHRISLNLGCILQVACLQDSDARLALDKDDPFSLQTKPHGHGDVHALLHSSGLVERWKAAGVKWVCFFQDTNGLVFRGLPAALGRLTSLQVHDLALPLC